MTCSSAIRATSSSKSRHSCHRSRRNPDRRNRFPRRSRTCQREGTLIISSTGDEWVAEIPDSQSPTIGIVVTPLPRVGEAARAGAFSNWCERSERHYSGLPVNSVRESTKQTGFPNGSLA